jgi:hypothetical protein
MGTSQHAIEEADEAGRIGVALMRRAEALINKGAAMAREQPRPDEWAVYVRQHAGEVRVTLAARGELADNVDAWAAPRRRPLVRMMTGMLRLPTPPGCVRVLLLDTGEPGCCSAFIWREGWAAPPEDAPRAHIHITREVPRG